MALGIAHALIEISLMRRGGNVSVDLSSFVLLYNKNFMNELKFNDKNNSLTVQIFFNLQNHPTFHSKERLVDLVRGRECFVGLSVFFVYAYS